MAMNRCNYRATDPITTRYEREDGWRCGHDEGHIGSHSLYTSDGEEALYAGVWVEGPEETVTFEDAARAEILDRLGSEAWHSDGGRRVTAFVAGSVWARDRLTEQEPTDAEVEAGARAVHERSLPGTPWEETSEAWRDECRYEAHAVLRAAARIRKEQK